tara:strand:+ start:942 stop:1829 length:888 start_codon:yes stop_codon:yes gene_type:complete
MKIKSLLIFLLFIYINLSCQAKTLDSNLVNKNRVVLVSSSLAAYFGASFYYVQNTWWSDVTNDFHFDPGNDLVYALNVDKAAHFFGGVYSSDLFSSSYRWAGVDYTRSLWYGACFGTGIQLAIELKDAYAPYWGFSKWDFAIGSAGSFWPVLQNYYQPLQALNFKFSYFKRSNIYWDLENQRGRNPSKFSWYDDYPNQTYWMTLDTDKLFKKNKFPKWIDFAFGFGLDDTQYLNGGTKMGGKQEFYIALDYDVNQILKEWDTPFAKKIKFILKYYKLPAPTIQVAPKLKFHPFFM